MTPPTRTAVRAAPGPVNTPQRGATAVELALVLGLLVLLIVALVDLTRWSLALVSTAEATRAGVRLAAVCSPDDSVVAERTRQRLQMVDAGAARVSVDYLPAGCSAATCQGVRVGLADAAVAPIGPWSPLGAALGLSSWPVPPMAAYLPREALSSSLDGLPNPACD